MRAAVRHDDKVAAHYSGSLARLLELDPGFATLNEMKMQILFIPIDPNGPGGGESAVTEDFPFKLQTVQDRSQHIGDRIRIIDFHFDTSAVVRRCLGAIVR